MNKIGIYQFIPSNDSMVQWMLPIAQRLDNTSFMVLPQRGENADFALQSKKIDFFYYKPGLLAAIRPSIIVLGNDWGREERQIILEARILGIPSVCIQEGVVNLFSDELMNAEYIFAHGSEILKYVHRDNLIITGNPKYDNLANIPLPHVDKVIINCNFVYGILEDKREKWVDDVITACNALHLDFQISQHPRDKGVFSSHYPVIRSNAFSIKEQLEQSSILVTRFSTLIYEACMAGRAVIYYNPYEENPRLLQEDYGAIFVAKNPKELERSLHDAVLTQDKLVVARQEFLLHHCGTLDHNAAERCVNALNTIVDEHENQLVLSLSESHALSPGHHQQFIRYFKHIEELFDWREGWLARKEQEVQIIIQQLDDYKKQLTTLGEQIKEKDRTTENVMIQLIERERQFADLSLTISEREAKIADFSKIVFEREIEILDFKKKVSEFDRHITKLNDAVSERDAKVVDLNANISERDRQITELTSNISEQEIQVADLHQIILERNAQITKSNLSVQDLTEQVRGKDQVVYELNIQLAEKEKIVVGLNSQVRSIANSSGWTLLQFLWTIRVSLAPHESRREKIFLSIKNNLLSLGKLNLRNLWRQFLQQENTYRLLRYVYRKLPIQLNSKNLLAKKILSNVPEFRHASLQIQVKQTFDLSSEIASSVDSNNGLLTPPQKRILVIEHRIPTPDKNSSSLRLYSMLKLIAGLGWEITFVSDSDDVNYKWILSDIKNELPKYEKLMRDLEIIFIYGIDRAIEHIKSEGGNYQFAILSYPEIMHRYAPLVRAFMPNAQLVYDTVDLHGVRFNREAIIKHNDITLLEKAKFYEQMECANIEAADIVIAITDPERDAILKRVPNAHVEIVPNIHSVSETHTPFEERQGLLFIGHYLHTPNEDAVIYFINDVLPHIQEKFGNIPFFILGSAVTKNLKQYESDFIHVIGYVDDPAPWFDKARIFVAPLRYGAGMKGKIGQSLGLGLPVVTTSIGAEGMMLENDVQVLIADDPVEFANTVIRLYSDAELWRKLKMNGLKHISEHFSETLISNKIQSLLEPSKNFDGEITKNADDLIKFPKMSHRSGSIGFIEKMIIGELIMICQPQLIIETGTYYGQTAQFLADFILQNKLPKCRIVTFDFPETINQLRQSNQYFSDHPEIELISGLLPNSLASFLENCTQPLDLAIRDADHNYEGVMGQLRLFHTKLRPGGYVFCHDYREMDSEYKDIVQAVDDFVEQFKYGMLPLNSSTLHDKEIVWGAAILRKPFHN